MKKSVIATMLASVFAFGVIGTGCQIHRSFDSLVPEEYGAWENYYIYHGNVRSKTTGEDGEPLFSHIVTDDKIYSVASCADSAAIGDVLYLCFTLSDGTNMEHAIVSYNVKTKAEKTLMLNYSHQDDAGVTHVYHPYAIERVYEDGRILLQGQHEQITVDESGQEKIEYSTAFFTVDYDGKFLEEISFAWYGYTRVSEDYFTSTIASTHTQEASIYYATWGMEQPQLIATVDNSGTTRTETQFVDKEGVKGFLLTSYLPEKTEQGTKEERLQKIEFFDIATNRLTTVYEGNDYTVWVEIPDNEYFYTYEYQTVTYTQKGGLFETPQQYTATYKQNCVLHQVVYSTSGVTVEKVHAFEEHQGVNTIRGIEDRAYCYASVEWYESASGCKKGGYQGQQYKINLKDGKSTKLDGKEWNASATVCYGSYALKNSSSYGGYAYYIERIALTTVYDNTTYAYRLQRYDAESKKTEVMQLWQGNGSQEGEKYCEMMWKNNGGDFSDFIVRDY